MKKQSFLLLSARTYGASLSLSVLIASPMAFGDVRPSNKTPDGIAVLVAPDDPALVSNPTPQKLFPTLQPSPTIAEATAQLIDDSLRAMAEKSDDKDTQWYENGVWKNPTENVWQVQSGPALAAATLWKWREGRKNTLDAATSARQDWLHRVAVETFDRQIKDHQHPDGSMDRVGTHIQFFITDMALAYLTLGDSLDDATKARWRNSLTGATDSLIQSGDLPDASKPAWKATDGWTTNGNVEIFEAEMAYLVGKITGEQKYKDLYETQWKHTLNPSQLRWGGYGLFLLKAPTKADGSDGAGYIAEAEPEPGFDPEYTQLQLSDAARLYVESGDPRALRVTNLLLNALWPRVNPQTWVLDATYGSRHSTRPPFMNCGVAIAGWASNRGDIAAQIPAQFEMGMKAAYLNNAQKNQGAPGLYRGYGLDPTTILQAALTTNK